MTTYAVTGATGGLGHGAVLSLLDRGATPSSVVAIARSAERAADLTALGVDVRVADYDVPATWSAALAGVDVLLLVSGSEVGRRLPQHTAVIDAAVAAGVRRVVYTSAPQADTSSFSLVDEHRATEDLLRAVAPTSTILRNNWYFENYTRDLAGTLDRGATIGSSGNGRVSAAARADYAEAAAVVMIGDGHDGVVYELGGDHAFTLAEFAATLAEVSGRPVTHHELSPEDHRPALVAAGLPEDTATFVVSIDHALGVGELRSDDGDLARLLGRPTTPLRDFLATVV